MQPNVMKMDVPRPPDARKIRTAAYCRVSTHLKTQESSMESQCRHYEEMIRANPDWDFVGIYMESGVSGTRAETRPELQRLLTDCRAGKIDLILTKSISRFSRNTTECLEMVRTLTGLGVNLFFEKENIHTATMDSELMLTLLACFAEDESRSISRNTKWGIRKRFQDGTFKSNMAAYGYKWENGQLVIVPERARIVKRIFKLTLAGNGMTNIARILNDDGIPAPRGGRWTPGSLKQIVKNPVYIGDVLYQKTYTDDNFTKRINYGELDQYCDKAHHRPIITPSKFKKAQALIARRAEAAGYKKERSKNRRTNKYCLTGLLRCGECGTMMHRTAWSDRRISWICQRHKMGSDLCTMKPQSEADVKRAFINCLNKLAWAQGSPNPSERILDVYEQMRCDRQDALTQLKHFLKNWTITGDLNDFPENDFACLIRFCSVTSQEKVTFHFTCGLHFPESLYPKEVK